MKIWNPQNARRLAQVLEAACYLAACFFLLICVLFLCGRTEVQLTNRDGSFPDALVADGGPGGGTRWMFTSIPDQTTNLAAFDGIDAPAWIGIAAMGVLRVAPLGVCAVILALLFRNVAAGRVFVPQNASLLLRGGLLLAATYLLVPLINAYAIPPLVNHFSSCRLAVGTTVSLSGLFDAFVMVVGAYVMRYGIYLQEEADHTL